MGWTVWVIESRWGARFSARVQTGLWPTLSPVQWVPAIFPGGGGGVYYPPPSSAEVEERVQLYLYSPSGLSCPVLGLTLPLPYLSNS